MAINTTASINTGSGAVATKPQAFYDKVLLKTLRVRSFDHERFAQTRPMPKNYGDTINFRKIGTLAPALTPLTEGVTPDGSTATITAISATTQQYGDYMEFSDRVNFQMVDPILTEYSKEQGVQASETKDTLVRDELAAGSNVMYEGGKTSRATLALGDKPTVDTFRKARLTLKKNHVRPTAGGKYVALISSDVTFDLLDDPKFLKAYEIGQQNKPFIEGEIADVYGIKFVEVDNAKIFEGAGASSANVHASIMFGEEAYGITKVNGEGDVQTIVKALGSGGTQDPLNQRQTIGWKLNAFVAKRLKEEAIIRLESVPSNA
jgi:N4-gp56 family major capsid protein